MISHGKGRSGGGLGGGGGRGRSGEGGGGLGEVMGRSGGGGGEFETCQSSLGNTESGHPLDTFILLYTVKLIALVLLGNLRYSIIMIVQ